ncbi:DUF2267 domain-containing protein [Pseudonocardia sp. C8]|uniref:DUF2267 domain-containing protein n=1 Tax=Pseudonocardia sp. C8 TaxID=2762759 RepID=UPI00164276DD|nr:DUF2267 domain-containing protein [Pseudonocardia sp. C8]MBC3192322.1 DUF2267 domain-containing protein [Pseudonocardia sp. C8]
MIRYQELVEAVRDRAGLPDAREAREATGIVLGTLVRALPSDAREHVLGAMPSLVEAVADVGEGPRTVDPERMIQDIAGLLKRPPEQALLLARAVLDEIDRQDPDTTARIAGSLPDGALESLRGGAARWDEVTATPERPTALTADEVARELARLENWDGDPTRISRTVAVPDERVEPLAARVQEVARRRNDHAHLERGRGELTIVLRTADQQVTRPDIELAADIDHVVAEAATGGRARRG